MGVTSDPHNSQTDRVGELPLLRMPQMPRLPSQTHQADDDDLRTKSLPANGGSAYANRHL